MKKSLIHLGVGLQVALKFKQVNKQDEIRQA